LRKETPDSFLPTSINDDWHRYTAASVNTRNTASWTYGRFEIMAKMPQGKGGESSQGEKSKEQTP